MWSQYLIQYIGMIYEKIKLKSKCSDDSVVHSLSASFLDHADSVHCRFARACLNMEDGEFLAWRQLSGPNCFANQSHTPHPSAI